MKLILNKNQLCISRNMMKVFIVLAVLALLHCASGNNTTPVSVPRLPAAHYFENGTVAWFPKVAGGQVVRLGEVDGIVSIQNQNGNHLCTGTLVMYNLVLTAAHCVTDLQGVKLDPRRFRIVADDLGIVGAPNRTRQTGTVLRVHFQPRYSPWSANYDIAILELETPFNRTSTLRYNSVLSHKVTQGNKCHVAGWGSTSQNFTVQLHRIELEVTDINLANGTQFFDGLIPSGSFAANSIDGNSSCLGDPGSALICDDHIAGILSFGYGCSRSDYPLVFTQATLSYRWVDGIISNATKITPAGGESPFPVYAATVYQNNSTNSTNSTFGNNTGGGGGGTTTRRPGSGGGAGSIQFSASLLAVTVLHFLLLQYILKLIQ